MTLLDISKLTVQYITERGAVTALNSVDLKVEKNELLAVVGESGCGKTTLGLSIIGLLPKNSVIASGSINYKGKDISHLSNEEMRNYRGTEIAMIFQEPLTSLNPVYKIADQLAEAIIISKSRKKKGRGFVGEFMQKVYDTRSISFEPKIPRFRRSFSKELRREMVEWLKLVRIPDPEQVLERYPFELSGGMRQRVMIAMALSQQPALLIADEPTTALDVTIQAQVLKIIRALMDEVETSVILVTHDLAVASQVADRIAVMYAGQVVEYADVNELFIEPLHPYTKGLLNSIPRGTKFDSDLRPVPGSIPDLMNLPKGCKFAPRCPYSFERCKIENPVLLEHGNNHFVACFLYDK